MGMDRNTVIGFVLIGMLLMGMFYFNSQENQAYQVQQKRISDSIAKLRPKVDPVAVMKDSLTADKMRKLQSAGGFQGALNQPEQLTVLENDVMKVTFSNKGAQPKIVELKKFKTFEGKPVILQNSSFNKISYSINSGNQQVAATSDLLFASAPLINNADKSQTLSFSLKDSSGNQEVKHVFTMHPNEYMIDFSIQLEGADQLVTQQSINLLWQTQTERIEKDLTYEKEQTQIAELSEGEFDSEMLGSGSSKKFEKGVNWIAVKQQFFISTLLNKNKFSSAEVKWMVPSDTGLHIIAQTAANFRMNVPSGRVAQIPLQLYYGPSDYNILKIYGTQLEKIVPYGSSVFAFVKYINRHFLLPVFDLLRKNVASMGIVILLLTLFIRLLTSPIIYKSYVSGAKMKALKPEIDKLKDKHGEDKQAFSMDQMKLWKSAGVSPLGGCLPELLKIPIFMSLYYFFQGNISLRGENFLWAKDLAAYDSIYNMPFSIPFYGDHISLFTITATLTSLLISIYSMSSMQDNSNPVMKYMPYIFPVMLLGVFNNLPSALTWYYTISNTITLVLQIIIQKYIIDHDKILAQIEINRKKPVKQSKLQEKIQAMQQANQKVIDLKSKTKK
jgi:YidC/Oxa1 family membrane protein insertase